VADRRPAAAAAAAAALALCACVGALPDADEPGAGPAPRDLEALAIDYRGFLDAGRTAALAVGLAAARSGFRAIDPARDDLVRLAAGDRVVLIDRGRSALFVLVGKAPLERGARMVGAHVDTPAPRLVTAGLTRSGQLELRAEGYGGLKLYQWVGRPLALVGEVHARGGARHPIALGLGDDPPLWATEVQGGALVVVASSTPTEATPAGPPRTLVDELHARHGLTAADLAAAELYLVPAEPAREVGLDRAFIGAHGQDDRANSYLAWRALIDQPAAPPQTAIVWLVDREETGSSGPTGARSRFLELSYAYLLAATGAAASETALHRALAATVALSADTPACVEPNWPEVHELKHGPLAGRGPVVFPFTGGAGKMGGSAASAELVAAVGASFARAGVPLQRGQLGRVDEGGGGTIAADLAHRGMDVLDLGVCVMNMHSPLELIAKRDLWATYLGLRHWLGEPEGKERP
jgi:aspartyl aminopeptidase